jgi:hypothetical protein
MYDGNRRVPKTPDPTLPDPTPGRDKEENKMNDTKLRVEGHLMKEIVIFGNGKDSELFLEADEDDVPTYRIAVRDPGLVVEIDGKVRTEVFNDGHDPYLGVRYLPQEPMVFDVCRIEDPPADDEYDDGFARSLEEVDFRGEIKPGYMISGAEIRLCPKGRRA